MFKKRKRISKKELALKIVNTINEVIKQTYSEPLFSIPGKQGTHSGVKNKCVYQVTKLLEEYK